MPSFATNILPTNPGLNLGASNQPWNIWANLLNGSTPVNLSVSVVPWTANPTFSTTAIFTVINITLTGNVTASTFTGVPGLILFQITQDGVGGRTFTWPTSFLQPTAVGQSANQTTMQLFYFDGTNAWPIGPGVVNP